MTTRRATILALMIGMGAILAGPAFAMEAKAFDQAAFEAAKNAGRSILVEVTAPWCPVCRAQKPILSELRATPKFKDLVVFDVDFDSRKDILRTLGVQKQSTLITFKGGTETGRSTGETRKTAIEALLEKAI